MEDTPQQNQSLLEFRLLSKLRRMKNYIHILALGFFSFGLFSCSDLLNEEPKDQILTQNFFESESDAVAAVNSIYSILNATSTGPTFGGVYHSSYWVLQGLASDNMQNEMAGAIYEERLENFTHTPTNGLTYDLWQNMYKGIFYANFALEGINQMEIDEDLKERLLGEARFLRAVLNFDLVRLFGEVPLVTIENQTDLSPTKARIEDIFSFIITDLELAANTLPASYSKGNGLGRVTSGAAHAMLGRVNLWTGDPQSAVDHLKIVIDSEKYSLWNDFSEAFRISNENGKESVFGIGFGDGGGSISFWEVGQFNVRLLPSELSGEVNGINAQGWQIATQDLYKQYDPLDQRRAVSFITQINNSDGSITNVAPHFSKYWDRIDEPFGGNTKQDFPHIRYSGVLLMYAEALNEAGSGPNGEAYDAINAVRERARFDGNVAQPILPDLAGLSYQEFKDAVLLERRLELAVEGHRWFDLVRHNKLVEKVSAAKPDAIVQEYHALFPIPQREIDINPGLLPQNTGY